MLEREREEKKDLKARTPKKHVKIDDDKEKSFMSLRECLVTTYELVTYCVVHVGSHTIVNL